jgi:hypothetical protein
MAAAADRPGRVAAAWRRRGAAAAAGITFALLAPLAPAAAPAGSEALAWYQVDLVVFAYQHPSDEQVVHAFARHQDARAVALEDASAVWRPGTLAEVASTFGVWPSGPRARVLVDARVAAALDWVDARRAAERGGHTPTGAIAAALAAANTATAPGSTPPQSAVPVPGGASPAAAASVDAAPAPSPSGTAPPRPAAPPQPGTPGAAAQDTAASAAVTAQHPPPPVAAAYVTLPRDEMGLADAARRLAGDPAVQVLLVTGWRQPLGGVADDYPVRVDWPGATLHGDGQLTLRMRGGIELALDLFVPAPAPAVAAGGVPAAGGGQPPAGTAKAPAIAAGASPGPTPSWIAVHHRQRIVPGRVHYLDHPSIGCLLRVQPLAVAAADDDGPPRTRPVIGNLPPPG